MEVECLCRGREGCNRCGGFGYLERSNDVELKYELEQFAAEAGQVESFANSENHVLVAGQRYEIVRTFTASGAI